MQTGEITAPTKTKNKKGKWQFVALVKSWSIAWRGSGQQCLCVNTPLRCTPRRAPLAIGFDNVDILRVPARSSRLLVSSCKAITSMVFYSGGCVRSQLNLLLPT